MFSVHCGGTWKPKLHFSPLTKAKHCCLIFLLLRKAGSSLTLPNDIATDQPLVMAETEKQERSQDGPILQSSFQENDNLAEQASHSTDQTNTNLSIGDDHKKKLGVLWGSALMQLPLWGKQPRFTIMPYLTTPF